MKFPAITPAWAFAGILLFGLLAMTARPALDPDLWWHLRTGQWIVETGKVPHADPFSFTRTGQPWVSHEWLSEVAFYAIWRLAGFGGLIVFSAAVTTAGFMLLYFRCGGIPYLAAAATVLGAVASAPAWGVRPQMFTFALASLLLWLLETGERRPWILLAVPPMFLLWLNLHGGFALAPALMLAYACGLLVEAAVGDEAWRDVRGPIFRIVALVVGCLALVPLNPSGSQLYHYPFDTLLSSAMRTVIVEWFSADFHQPRFAAFLLLWLVLLAVLALGKNRPKARVLVLLVMTGGLGLDAVRHIAIFVLVAVPVIASGLPRLSRRQFRTEPARGRARGLALTVAMVLLAGFAVTRWSVLIREQPAAEAEHFPAGAAEILRAGDFGGQVFAYYDWGGYTIFKLYPKYRVFVDGRADLYGGELLRQFQTAVQVREGWRQVVDGWNLRVVLVPPHSALAQALALDPGWHTEYQDAHTIMLVRAPKLAQNVTMSQSHRHLAEKVQEWSANRKIPAARLSPLWRFRCKGLRLQVVTGNSMAT